MCMGFGLEGKSVCVLESLCRWVRMGELKGRGIFK